MDGVKGKVAIVTGGATLIGTEVVRAFHGARARHDYERRATQSHPGRDADPRALRPMVAEHQRWP